MLYSLGNFLFIQFIFVGASVLLIMVLFFTAKVMFGVALELSFVLNTIFLVLIGIAVFLLSFIGGYQSVKIYSGNPDPELENEHAKESDSDDGYELNEEYVVEFIFDQNNLRLYEQPVDDSNVVHELSESRKIEVIDESAGWYRVLLEDRIHGWVKIDELGTTL